MAGPIQRGHAIGALVLGIIEALFGLIIIIISVVLAGKGNFSATASPYWAGIMFAIPGILGIITGLSKNHCSMIAFMVLNIISFILQIVAVILAFLIYAIFSGVSGMLKDCTEYGGSCVCVYNGTTYTYTGVTDCKVLTTVAGMLLGVVIMLILASIVSLASSILGCASVCCSNNGSTQGTVVNKY